MRHAAAANHQQWKAAEAARAMAAMTGFELDKCHICSGIASDTCTACNGRGVVWVETVECAA